MKMHVDTRLKNKAYAASQYSSTLTVSRIELVEALENAGDSVFTVTFCKRVNQKDIVANFQALDKIPSSKTELNKIAKVLLAGTERTMVGYLDSTEPNMGRSKVVDLEVSAGKHQLRLVDHRTVKELILQDVRYVLKG